MNLPSYIIFIKCSTHEKQNYAVTAVPDQSDDH